MATSFQITDVEVRKFETIFTLDKADKNGFRHLLFVRGENRVMRDILTGMFSDPKHSFTFDAVEADEHYPKNFCRITRIARIISQ